jgi:outer membrane protein OmpA-like peptidoglycan-associated protein
MLHRCMSNLLKNFAVGAARGTGQLLLGACLVALGALAWLCVARHAPVLAAARTPAAVSVAVVAPPVLPTPVAPLLTPEPPAPLRVQAALDQLLTAGRIEFETASDKLRPEASPLLDAIAAQLLSAPELEVEVEGHTDARGDPGANRRLSVRRADAVKVYLIGKGIPGERIHTLGSGATRPLVRSRTPEANQQNRRIEFRVLTPGGR